MAVAPGELPGGTGSGLEISSASIPGRVPSSLPRGTPFCFRPIELSFAFHSPSVRLAPPPRRTDEILAESLEYKVILP